MCGVSESEGQGQGTKKKKQLEGCQCHAAYFALYGKLEGQLVTLCFEPGFRGVNNICKRFEFFFKQTVPKNRRGEKDTIACMSD